MLVTAEDLKAYAIGARDGDIGAVEDLYFDDQSWSVRYLVVNAGDWLSGPLVLISPNAIGAANRVAMKLPTNLTRQQVEDAPGIGEHEPVSRQYEAEYADYYGYPYYWGGGVGLGLPLGTGAPPVAAAPPDAARPADGGEPARQEDGGDPHLRSTEEVKGYDIQARDGEIGHVEDFVVDDEDWRIRHIVVDTRDWLPGKKVLVSPESIEDVSWEERSVRVELTREQVERSPEYDPANLTNQQRYGEIYV